MTHWPTIAPCHNEVIRRVVAVFRIEYERGPVDLAVEVHESSDSPGTFFGVMNYEFWGPGQAESFIHGRPAATVEAAVSEALKTYRSFDREEYPKEVIFWVPTYGDRSVVVNGCGERMFREEAERVREIYRRAIRQKENE